MILGKGLQCGCIDEILPLPNRIEFIHRLSKENYHTLLQLTIKKTSLKKKMYIYSKMQIGNGQSDVAKFT